MSPLHGERRQGATAALKRPGWSVRGQVLSAGRASTSRRAQGDTSVLQGTSDRARRHAQVTSDPSRGPLLGVELLGSVHVLSSKRPPIARQDSVTPDVADDRRPMQPERRRQLLYEDTPAVGGDEIGHLLRPKATLHRQTGNESGGRANRRLAGALPQHRPERRQLKYRAVYLRKRAAPGRRRWSCTVTR